MSYDGPDNPPTVYQQPPGLINLPKTGRRRQWKWH